jgi:DNA-(apurinic or apyrimidinic site) lyase
MKRKKLEEILKKIPPQAWDKIVSQEPEYVYFKDLRPFYHFGAFAIIMVVSGLNAYQLKGKAQDKYFPILKNHLLQNENKKDFESLRNTFLSFYEKERSYKGKLKRVNNFFDSNLAKTIWKQKSTSYFKRHFKNIWEELAFTMRSKKEKKTIAFAMKCLGVGLVMEGCKDFDFEGIPIPVDSRVKHFVKKIGLKDIDDSEIIAFFENILTKLPNINMVHLDSLIWQIGKLEDEELDKYFEELGCKMLAKELKSIFHA